MLETVTSLDAAVLIESEVREAIRARGLDPGRDESGMRDLVDEALADYERRALLGELPLLTDHESVAKAVFDAICGLGPLQPFLDDPEVEELWINEPGRVFVARSGRAELTTVMLTESQVRDLVERMLRASGRRLDLSMPFVDAALPGGERLHVAIPDVTRRHWAVNIRKFLVRAAQLPDMVELGALSVASAEFLHAAVTCGLNILVSGATQAGKTTMLNALTGSIPSAQRLITCEEVFELQPQCRDVVGLQCRQTNLDGAGEIPLRRLVKEALRMRPDRIAIGEVREAESLDMLIALNSGIPGLGTIHANSAREALTKLCTLPLLAGENIGSAFVVPTVAAAIDVVVHLELDHLGRRAVREIVAVTGRAEAGVVETATLYEQAPDPAGRPALRRGSGYPPHEERFARWGFDLGTLLSADDAYGSRRSERAAARHAPVTVDDGR